MGFATLMIKATRLCNLRCAYCHDWRAGRDQVMPFSVLAHMTAKVLADPTHSRVDFDWHGGETTLLPISFYERALYLQARFRRPGQRIVNGIQTNGTRLTPAWVAFFRENDFRVGVSIDGPPEVHDSVRVDARGRPTFERAMAGIRLLREHGVSHSVLMVIDEAALVAGPDRIFDFFVGEGIRHFALLAVKPNNEPEALPGSYAEHYVSPDRMNEFLIRLYDKWLDYGDYDIWIRELGSLMRRVRNEPGGICTLAGGCLGQNYLVEPNGEVAHCDFFLGDDRYTFGNILVDDFSTIRRAEAMLMLKDEEATALTGMESCPEFGVCKGWCPHERYLSLRHNPNHGSTCCGLRTLISHIREHPVPTVRPLNDGRRLISH